MKDIPIEKFGMSYPKIEDNELYNGGIHPVEAAEMYRVNVFDEPTDFYLLGYYDTFIDPDRNTTYYTFLRRENVRFTKVSVLNPKSISDHFAASRIFLSYEPIDVFEDTKFIPHEDPIKDIETLLNIPYFDPVSIYISSNEDEIHYYIAEDNFDESISPFIEITEEDYRIKRYVLKTVTSIEEITLTVQEEKPTIVLYIGPNGGIYSQVPFNLDKVDTNSLDDPLPMDDLYKLLKSANVICTKFDTRGSLQDATDADVESIMRILNLFFNFTSTKNELQIYSYKEKKLILKEKSSQN